MFIGQINHVCLQNVVEPRSALGTGRQASQELPYRRRGSVNICRVFDKRSFEPCQQDERMS